MAIDPICKMTVDEKTAKFKSEYKGKTYYFCAPGCKKKFEAAPATFLVKAPAQSAAAQPAAEPARVKDPVCGMKGDEVDARAEKLTSEYQGKTYCFCNENCKKQFVANPAKYLTAGSAK